MSRVVVYTTPFCPHCRRAVRLLRRKGVPFAEIDVAFRPARRAEMEARSGRRTVPQIFVGDRHLGGCDELHALEATGELDRILAEAGIGRVAS